MLLRASCWHSFVAIVAYWPLEIPFPCALSSQMSLLRTLCPLKVGCSLQVFQLSNLMAVQSRCCPLASSLQQGFSLQDCSSGV